jgi:hypothetical protein
MFEFLPESAGNTVGTNVSSKLAGIDCGPCKGAKEWYRS